MPRLVTIEPVGPDFREYREGWPQATPVETAFALAHADELQALTLQPRPLSLVTASRVASVLYRFPTEEVSACDSRPCTLGTNGAPPLTPSQVYPRLHALLSENDEALAAGAETIPPLEHMERMARLARVVLPPEATGEAISRTTDHLLALDLGEC